MGKFIIEAIPANTIIIEATAENTGFFIKNEENILFIFI